MVRWDRIESIGIALLSTAVDSSGAAAQAVPTLLERLTRAHRLLEDLSPDAESVLAGDFAAKRRLADRLRILIGQYPDLVRTAERLQAITTRRLSAEPGDPSEGTLNFDALARIATASLVALQGESGTVFEQALDVIIGLALQTEAAEKLDRGLTAGGAHEAARALNDLRLAGHPAVSPMQVMAGGFGGPLGLPGAPGGNRPGSPGGNRPGIPGVGNLPLGPDEILDFVTGVLGRVRDRGRWDPEITDTVPGWRVIAGLAPENQIDSAELARVRCVMAIVEALKVLQEPPPPRPARVVWSDTIVSITASGLCPGDRITIHGRGFGPPNPGIGVMLPTSDGCTAFPVPAADWTAAAIHVVLPENVISGPVGLVDFQFASAYNAWAARINEATKTILEKSKCARQKAPDIHYVPLFQECAPLTPVNFLRAGRPFIRFFNANGQGPAFVNPGQSVKLEWLLVNTDSFTLKRVSSVGPQFAGTDLISSPPGAAYDLGPFSEQSPVEGIYELQATGPCGSKLARVSVFLRGVPRLSITGIEVTQGIQVFRNSFVASNLVPLVASKDTIVRVYVAVENLGSFAPDGTAGQVKISGEARLTGPALPLVLPPANAPVNARPDQQIDRANSSHTLNFRIPAAAATNTKYTTVLITAWTVDQVEEPPSGIKTRPSAQGWQAIVWNEKTPYRVRYIRIDSDDAPALDDAAARTLIVRGFDLLATPPTDIAPARIPIWHTSLDLSDDDGMDELLDHIDDQHNCTLSEQFLPWEDDCPDDDGAVWVGVLAKIPGTTRGTTEDPVVFHNDRNTSIVSPVRETIAHELGHTLKLNHVNSPENCGASPEGDFDSLPDGGRIAAGDAFDPSAIAVIGTAADGTKSAVYDLMSYGCKRWVHPITWRRVFDKF